MCTLIVAFRAYADVPLLVAANRDERFDRPAVPPARRNLNGVSVFAPQDRLAGGTWIGMNRHGVFAGITNRAGGPPDPTRPSRGRLVPKALSYPTAAEARTAFLNWPASGDNGFHLVVADAHSAFVLVSDTEVARLYDWSSGVFVVTERSFSDKTPARAQAVIERLQFGRRESERRESEPSQSEREHGRDPSIRVAAGGLGPAPSDETLRNLLTIRAEHSPEGTLVSIPEIHYGTRASTIIRLYPQDVRFLHADGRPDTTDYVDLSADARAFLRTRA